jgi:hypothetical protein
MVARDVEQGREALNFSTWDEDDGEADDAAEAVARGGGDRSGPGGGGDGDEDRSGPGGGGDRDEDRSGPGGG